MLVVQSSILIFIFIMALEPMFVVKTTLIESLEGKKPTQVKTAICATLPNGNNYC